jgi:hypothetical protein
MSVNNPACVVVCVFVCVCVCVCVCVVCVCVYAGVWAAVVVVVMVVLVVFVVVVVVERGSLCKESVCLEEERGDKRVACSYQALPPPLHSR